MTKTIIALLTFVFSIAASAQDPRNPRRDTRPNFNQSRVKPEQPNVKVISKLDKAIGISLLDFSKKPERKDKKIERLDNFRKLEFVNLGYKDENQYFGLKKEYNTGYFVKNNFREAWVISTAHTLWLIDKDDYRSKIESMTDTDTELRFDIALKRNMLDDNFPLINGVSEASNSELVLKLQVDKDKNKVYFLFYVIDNKGVITGLNVAAGKDANLKPGDKFSETQYKQIVSPTLDGNYCYETDYKTFKDFIKAPITQ